MPITADLGKYLGVPTIYGRMKAEKYQYLLDKISTKLKGSKAKTLSMPGRVTLAKSVLSSMPLYVMQSTLLPKEICDGIDQKIRSFVWGATEGERKIHLVSWPTLTKPICCGGLGIRTMRESNDANLAKLGWRILQQPDMTWAKLIRGKYCANRVDIDMFQSRSRSSRIWKGIVSGSKVLNRGARVAIGDGTRTLFWLHTWAGETPLVDEAVTEIPEEILSSTVAEMWNGTTWQWEIITPYLPAQAIARIQALTLYVGEGNQDKKFWGPAQNGMFTTSSAYRLITEERNENSRGLWRKIWQAPVQQRVRHFLYMAAHESFMCNAVRVRRHISNFFECARCGQTEDCLHTVRDCASIHRAWEELAGGQLQTNFFVSDMKTWIDENIKQGDEWSSMFGYMMWFIWKMRNAKVFKSQEEDFDRLIVTVRNAAADFRRAWKSRALTTLVEPHVQRSRGWQVPQPGWVKLNIDGASKGNPGMAGGGGIFRSDTGSFLKAFTVKIGHCNALQAELVALQKGLDMASALDFNRLIIEMDCLQVVKTLIQDTPLTHPNFYLL